MAAALTLDYIFSTTPDPIHASARGGAKDSKIDVDVIISNKSAIGAVTMNEIQITFPLGADSAADLAVSKVLDLTYDTSGPWKITTGANGSPDGAVTITPATGPTGTIAADSIRFTVRDITVNEVPGTVQLNIAETQPSTKPVSDDKTYRLEKLESDNPVTSFTADPPTLHDLDKSTTLTWTVSDDGKDYLYGLYIVGTGATDALAAPTSSAAATPVPILKDCATGVDCYTWDEGQKGVPVPPISQTTTFALRINTRDAGKQYASPTTTVHMVLPKFSSHSYYTSSPTGHLVSVHWIARNVDACKVVADQTTIDDNAPSDTWDSGYLVTFADAPPSRHDITVKAPTIPGVAPAQYSCSPQITINAPKTIPTGQFPDVVAFTPEGNLALVVNRDGGCVTVIDMNTYLPETPTIPTGQVPVAIAIAQTPDGPLALTADHNSSTVTFININNRVAVGTVSVPGPTGIAVTPDGKKALVTNEYDNNLMVIDIETRAIEGAPIPTGGSPWSVAISTDGKIAVTGDQFPGTLTVIDVPNQKVKGTIQVGTEFSKMAITPDGSKALVTNAEDNSVALIDLSDLSTLTVIATFGSSPAPYEVAISPDGSRAIVCNLGGHVGGGGLTLIDIPNRTFSPIHLEKPGDPALINRACGVAFAPDGSLALVSDGQSNQVIVL